MEDLGLKALTVVSTVAAHRSFRAAARDLDMSPSSVSHLIANLEKRLGIRLLARSTRSVSLTEAGQAFLARVRPALAEITEAIEGVHELRDRPAGLVRINASTWGADRLLPVIAGFLADYPEVRIDLVTDGRLVDIIAEGFDAGLRLKSIVPQDMVALPLGIEEALVIVGAPAYVEARGMPRTPGDLLGHECIRARLPSGAMMRWDLGKGGRIPDVEVDGRLTLGTTELAAKAAAAGLGLAYVERREAEPFLIDGRLVQILPDWTPPFEGEALYYPRQRHPSAAFRAFVDYVKAWKTDFRAERACSPA
ncbi:LysR substrate-binding domain-containing protein [Acuticoccus sediminis]|uniref:LysR substrate-binding domain-containing protein n=1 Tax=Acuticoccus sediminis TaxID=2184697 RepID=UPI001CFE4AC4|nr:LysR family transcriptional regulator [Acuticoccus sediminis]